MIAVIETLFAFLVTIESYIESSSEKSIERHKFILVNRKFSLKSLSTSIES